MKKIYSFVIAMAAIVAMPMFTSCSDKAGNETTAETANTTELEALLTECEALLEGATTTDYPESAITAFETTVTSVRTALTTGGLTQTVVNNLYQNLSAALSTFRAAEYGAIPEENLLLSFDFETEGNTQTSTGTLAYEAALVAGPTELFGNAATLPTFVEGVNGGKAISFDNGSHLEIAYYTYAEVLKKEFSISVWVKPTAIVPGNYVFSINSWHTVKLNIQDGGKPFFTVATDEGIADSDNERDQSVTAGNWTHLVVALSLEKHTLDFYVNGELTKSWTASEKPAIGGTTWATDYVSAADGSRLPIFIGTSTSYADAASGDAEHTAESWENGYSFNGAIDNLKIYDVALSDGQVSKLYNNESGK